MSYFQRTLETFFLINNMQDLANFPGLKVHDNSNLYVLGTGNPHLKTIGF